MLIEMTSLTDQLIRQVGWVADVADHQKKLAVIPPQAQDKSAKNA
ncbi:hypothetical protein Q7C_1990 [Methylophaga frappieri]|uniref:Uncharacterized protein n=1 Tax=Methylophaga frappieri (strain ATCC BAA-2434 / DSM 25690 / JAM7) TaxID=754477 RepID=I1YJN7_METFJ|nr:hypothetical protein Q7C_1990 [Methylophaga frappieri]